MAEGKRQFVAAESWHEPELASWYEKGLVYTVDPENTKLAAIAERWFAEQKIIWLEPGKEHSILKAVGTVT